ncbi:Sister chromatid cohesion protein 2 [Pleurotus ostreatus]|uniref:Sister chromatid cohesion protein n=1 Tax=Pleurotus ostreatus TaxID=5322 RepID=A0A8H7DMJ1_PLEOS|nr:Sister chromatid cohesion protein 2 [Pleurotus ostreatus]KAF7422876.1 Sister chromatid cohesion protein 2 [Pleurotus ostreatus]
MQGSSNWYPRQPQRSNQRTDGHHSSPEAPVNRLAADSVQDAHRLLAVFPTASATPSVHVARHLETMSMTAAPPSFAQPGYYNSYGHVPQGSPNQYTEYSQEFEYISSPQHADAQSAYWQRTRNDAVRLLRNEVDPAYMHHSPSAWQPHTSQATNPFAQSVFQHMAPSNAYPTPPPPGFSTASSSLAYALGAPLSQNSQNQLNHRPQQSTQFFNHFLEDKSREMHTTHPQQSIKQQPQSIPPESPDPLSLKAVTPRKRKLEPVIEIVTPPAFKRMLASKPQLPLTPHTSSPSIPPTPVTAPKTPKRQFTMECVEIPTVPWATPAKKRRSEEDTGDEFGGYGSVDDTSIRRSQDHVVSSSKRTGDRDDRAPLERLISLIEDIFEAEDSLPTDVDITDLPSAFFSPLTVDPQHPLLQSGIIRKLTKYITQVARPPKRMQGLSGGPGTPRVKGRMAGIDVGILSRILKIVERSVHAGEDLDVFPGGPVIKQTQEREKTASPRKPTAKSKKVSERRSKSKTPVDSDDPLPPSAPQSSNAADVEVDFEKLARTLELAKESVLAADCCMALLASDRLPKQIYSEELITSCLSTVKNQLTKAIYPFVEASTDLDASHTHPTLYHLVKSTTASSTKAKNNRRLLGEVFQALSSILPRVNSLINAETVAMSDSIIIQAVYIAIGPFFVVDSGEGDTKGKKDSVVLNTFGKSAMRGLRLDALALIRSIFANHEEQRSWIIEEILSSLIKLSDAKQKAGQFRLRDGRSIRTVSALLLQLVQTSAHDVRLEARRIAKARQQSFAMKRQESFTESQQAVEEPFLDEHDLEEIKLYTTGLESAIKSAKTIVLFLTTRSGKGKATKNSNEAEYRTIFDNLISDLLVVLYWPEWPAAGLLLSIACKFMVGSLDDVNSATQTDTNAAKTIALDHLGVIAARIRSSALKVQNVSDNPDSKVKALKPLDEIVADLSQRHLDKLLAVHRDVASHLSKRASEDQAYDSARELTAATLGQELSRALEQINAWVTKQEDDGDLNLKDSKRLLTFGGSIKAAMRDVWKDAGADVFDVGSQDEVSRVDRMSEEVGTIQALRNSFTPILNIILTSLDAPAIFMRTKALRALGQIITSDANILSAPNVRRAIESHLLDSSPAVRDAAVELIGKYMVDSPEVASDYYPKIADRIADTGLSVRKRVIKLLKAFYGATEDIPRRIDIATRLVLRNFDEDDTVKDLAVKSIEELWFQNPLPPSALKKGGSSHNASTKAPLLNRVSVVMGVAANFRDRQSPLEDTLHRIVADKQDSEAASLHAHYSEICEALIDGLVDDSDLPGFTVLNCIRTIYLFTLAYPAILSGSHASTLLPYLKNATSAEEQATSDYLLKIFRVSIPHMPKTEAKFGAELQITLQPMIVKPSGGILALQETVACMCTVVQHLTHDFSRLAALLKSCNARLQQTIQQPSDKPVTPNEAKAQSVLIFIVSLLGEHCNFDRLRESNPSLASVLNSVTQGSIMEHIYASLLKLYDKYTDATLRGRILQCLETTKGKSKSQDVDMEELVGNTDGFADSGVSSAVVQRYLSQILEAALSQNWQIQAAAIDILTFTIKQGLAHPLQSVPVIVALETSSNAALSNRASALHAILHSKHASLLNSRYVDSARASFVYQRKIASGPIQGYRMEPTPTALLQRWYSLVKEKRASRQDFLRSLVKVFEGRPSEQCTQDDVDFTRFMAENFASLDYKTQEEVMTVIKTLTAILSTTGTQLLEIISPSHLLSQLKAPADPSNQPGSMNDVGTPDPPTMLATVIIGMVMLLKAYLKSLYGISEDKCNKFIIGKKSALGDKAAVRRHETPISWERLPFASTPLLTSEDMAAQRARFLDIWNEDGVTAEPDDEFS